jgi:hypothetical protein
MITKRYFFQRVENRWGKGHNVRFEGWYLFGFIRLYARQIELPPDSY